MGTEVTIPAELVEVVRGGAVWASDCARSLGSLEPVTI